MYKLSALYDVMWLVLESKWGTLFYFTAQEAWDDTEVSGLEGGSVIINCKYDFQKYSNHTKFFCKCKDDKCINVPNPKEKKWDLKEKFFAVDEIQTGVYSILIRNLSKVDNGEYKCGVENKPQTKVELQVKSGEILFLIWIILLKHCAVAFWILIGQRVLSKVL